MATGIAELRNTPLHKILLEEGTIEFWSHTFEGNAQEVVLRLQEALRDGIALDMSDIFDLLDDIDIASVGMIKIV